VNKCQQQQTHTPKRKSPPTRVARGIYLQVFSLNFGGGVASNGDELGGEHVLELDRVPEANL